VATGRNRKKYCRTCPLSAIEGYDTEKSLCAQLVHNGKIFGYLIATLDRALEVDDEERSLFNEMAGDLAYTLNVLKMDADHKKSEQKRKALERQLLQSQKMESIGRLAGGVAHDYNNMLSVIIGYSELALEKAEHDKALYDDIIEILTAAKRSGDITRQLLAFARQQTIAPKVLDMNEIVESMLKMLRRLIGEDINLTWRPEAELWKVKIDPTQVDQMMVNLCINARDAIAEVGEISIATENLNLDETDWVDSEELVSGDYVLLSVSDNGSGMDKKTREKIFEPFFSTKALGQGTGLGLSTVYGIIKQNKGFVNVYSEPGKGTTFKIYLPRYIGGPKRLPVESTSNIPLSRGESVLLVEDEASILKLGKRMLKSLGYTVFDATTPATAVDLAEKCEAGIDLLITDVVMPEMNGRELADRLKSFYPELKVLFMSGYTTDVIAHRGVLDEGVFFMQKPFSKRDLAFKVREVLEKS
jgi:signal transduction histidine kinase